MGQENEQEPQTTEGYVSGRDGTDAADGTGGADATGSDGGRGDSGDDRAQSDSGDSGAQDWPVDIDATGGKRAASGLGDGGVQADSSIEALLARTMFRFKKLGPFVPNRHDVHIGELAVMSRIARDVPDSRHMPHSVLSEIRDELFISKAGVSQILNSLERKGYIRREINQCDRRKFILSLTPQGREILKDVHGMAQRVLDEVINRFGEENIRRFIALFDRFADITLAVKAEIGCEYKETEKGGRNGGV
jgi:DNA-binding MarR family transcriptional regulator